MEKLNLTQEWDKVFPKSDNAAVAELYALAQNAITVNTSAMAALSR